MSDPNDNHYYHCPEFIRYLCQEIIRVGAHKNPSHYSEIIEFTRSPEGREAYKKFTSIDPRKLATDKTKKTTTKRIFQI